MWTAPKECIEHILKWWEKRYKKRYIKTRLEPRFLSLQQNVTLICMLYNFIHSSWILETNGPCLCTPRIVLYSVQTSQIQTWLCDTRQQSETFYRPPTKLWKGNVFSRVCMSVCPRECGDPMWHYSWYIEPHLLPAPALPAPTRGHGTSLYTIHYTIPISKKNKNSYIQTDNLLILRQDS